MDGWEYSISGGVFEGFSFLFTQGCCTTSQAGHNYFLIKGWDPWKADRSEWRSGVQFLEAHPKYKVVSHLGGKIIILAVFIWAPGESKGQQYFLVVVAVPGTLMLNKKNALEFGDGVACSPESTVSLSWKNASPSLQPLTGDFPEEISSGQRKISVELKSSNPPTSTDPPSRKRKRRMLQAQTFREVAAFCFKRLQGSTLSATCFRHIFLWGPPPKLSSFLGHASRLGMFFRAEWSPSLTWPLGCVELGCLGERVCHVIPQSTSRATLKVRP